MIIYQIENNINGKRYIGQTTQSLGKRWIGHCYGGKKACTYMYYAIKKYGKENFTLSIIDKATSIEELNNKEEFWIKFLDTMVPSGYNLTSGGLNCLFSEKVKNEMSLKRKGNGNSMYGKKQSDSTRKKISEKAKGRIVSQETKKKLSEAGKLRKHTEEEKRKISESNKGKKMSPESIEKMRRVKIGKKASEETKKKMSETRKGRTAWNKGTKHTEETKQKMRNSRAKGKKLSPEVISRMCIAQKKAWIVRKAKKNQERNSNG